MTRKVLMLHGIAQSGEIFSHKTKGLRTELEKLGFELCYATANNTMSPADVPDGASDDVVASGVSDVLTWVHSDPAKGDYEVLPSTLKYLHQYVVDNGPFEGLIGFSQGAGVGGYLMTDFNGLLGLTPDQQPAFKFFIAFSGFKFQLTRYQKQYADHPISVPSLHVQGELDTVTESEKVQALYEACTPETRTFLKHAGGHYVPNSRGFSKKVVAWLEQVDPVS